MQTTADIRSAIPAALKVVDLNLETLKEELRGKFGDHAGIIYNKFIGSRPVYVFSESARHAELRVGDLVYTAVDPGVVGNQISITYTAGATAGAEVVSVSNYDITIQIEDKVSTATQIKTAFDASSSAIALASCNYQSPGAGFRPQAIASKKNLSGGSEANKGFSFSTAVGLMDLINRHFDWYSTVVGNTVTIEWDRGDVNGDGKKVEVTTGSSIALSSPVLTGNKLASLVVQDLTYTSKLYGVAGNAISIEYTSGGTAGSEVVTVVGTDISVEIESGVSTALQIQSAIEDSEDASALVTVEVTGSGEATQESVSQTALSGGLDAIAAQAAIQSISADYILNDEGFTLVDAASTPIVFKFSKNGGVVSGEDITLSIETLMTAKGQIQALPASRIVNDEGFILLNSEGVGKVFKFSLDGGDVTDEDYIVPISTGDIAEQVAEAISAVVDNSEDFESSVVGLSELMPNQADRDFSDVSAWTNVDINTYDATGDLSITANGVGQYCTLPVLSAPTTIGKPYTLTFDVANIVSSWTIMSFDGTQTIGTVNANGVSQTLSWIATTTGGLRIVSVANDSSADFDNFSLVQTGRVDIEQSVGGVAGNRTNTDTVTDELFLVSNFTGGTDLDDADAVAEIIKTAVNGHDSFTAMREGSIVTVTQATPGFVGNQTNSDTVTDNDFIVDDFTGGTDAISATLAVQSVLFTAVTPGVDGNNITIEYTGGGTAGAETVIVDDTHIIVDIEPGVSTATQVVTAVAGTPAAAALVTPSTSAGSTVQNDLDKTNLAGGTNASTTVTVDPLVVPIGSQIQLDVQPISRLFVDVENYLNAINTFETRNIVGDIYNLYQAVIVSRKNEYSQ